MASSGPQVFNTEERSPIIGASLRMNRILSLGKLKMVKVNIDQNKQIPVIAEICKRSETVNFECVTMLL